LYESQYVCAVCQAQGCHIHHIDGDHSNDTEDNLVVLCVKHHDEAHTKRQLSHNLDADALRRNKHNWTSAVQEKRVAVATLSGQNTRIDEGTSLTLGVTWGYINHKRVAQMARPDLLSKEDRDYFEYCRAAGIIDSKGILIKPKNAHRSDSYIRNSVYDWYEFGDNLRLHMVYAAFVDQISQSVQPVHLEPASWTKACIRDLVRPGYFIFVERPFYFKMSHESMGNQHRRCQTFKRKIRIEFFVDTQDMFGTTSMTVSFSGHKTCASLLHVKSLEEAASGWLTLHCSPIALGVGFRSR
jgi:hypothetical protein